MKKTLAILTQPTCVQCASTYRSLDKKGIPYISFNLSDPADLAAGGRELHEEAKALGYMQAPVGLLKDADGNTVDHWGGFRPDKIAEYGEVLKSAAPVPELAAA